MDSVLKDLRYALRGLVRSPGFTLTAVLALALGIGANTAIFSVVNPVLFKPLPYPDADRLVSIVPFESRTGLEGNVSYPELTDWRDQAQTFDGIAAFDMEQVAVGAPTEPVRAWGMFATPNLFSVLGRAALWGRTLLPEDGDAASPPVVVLSHWLWIRHFRSDPRVVGRDIQIDGKTFTVVGVMPEDFRFPSSSGFGAGLWAPLQTRSNPELMQQRGQHYLAAVGRLKPGVGFDQASAEMTAIAARLHDEHPDQGDINSGLKLVDLHARAAKEKRPVAFVLLAAVGLVLLIACANVANLILARSNARQREFAIRRSLGASRGRIARQLLTESLLLSLLGAGTGLLLSLWLTDGFKVLVNDTANQIRIDSAVLLFTLAVAVVTGVAFGLVPVVGASRTALHGILQDAGTRASLSRGRLRLQNLLIASQLSLAFALLASAALMVKTLMSLTLVNPGFEPRNLVAVRLPLPEWSYTKERKVAFYRRVFAAAQALPGVVAAGGGSPFPFESGNSRTSVTVEGYALAPGEQLHPNMYEVSPEYFRAMGIPVLEGRTFSEADRAGEALGAVIINQKFARRFWPNESALGKRISLGDGVDDPKLEVVGVVGDVRHGALEVEPPLQFYKPYESSPWLSLMMVVRTQGAPEALVPVLRRLIRDADPSLPAAEPELATAIMASTTANRRVAVLLLCAFAAVALALATFGLYGLITYAVGQRRHEFAIRIALGAQPRDVIRDVLSKGVKVAAVGLGLGLALALVGGRLLASLLYGVGGAEPLIYLAITLVLGASALLASYVPARRATRVNPLAVLRAE